MSFVCPPEGAPVATISLERPEEGPRRVGAVPIARSAVFEPRRGNGEGAVEDRAEPDGIDKRVLPIGEIRRYQNKAKVRRILDSA